MNFPINRIYYIAIITFAIVLSYYLLAGKNKFPKLWGGKRGYQSNLDKYDWEETFRRDKVYLAISIPYLIVFVLLSNYFGAYLGKIGLVIFVILSIIISIWRGPVKKKL